MEIYITLALILGILVVPGLINYYVNRYFTPPGTSSGPTSELVTASLTLAFVFLVLDIASVLLISLVWDDLKDQIAKFVQMGLVDFARDRPIALTGVLTAWSLCYMSILGLLGVLRVPGRWVR